MRQRSVWARPTRTATTVALVVPLVVLLLISGCASEPDSSSSAEGSNRSKRSTTTTHPPAEGRPSEGCGTEPAVAGPSDDPPGDVPLTFETAEGERTYRLGIPESYDPDEPAPLILNLHGAGSNAVQMSLYSDLPRRAGERGFVTVAPDSTAAQWQLVPEGTDDDFLMALLDQVESDYCIDLDRVHATGISLGSWKATVTGCAHDDRFASLALVAEEVRPGDCPPLPVVAFHGTADGAVPYGEGADPGIVVTGPNAGLSGARTNIASWAEGGGCSPEHRTRRIGDDVEKWSYPGCDEGIDVVLYTIEGGGHTWPGADIKLGDPSGTTETIDATDIALDWFEAHPRVT